MPDKTASDDRSSMPLNAVAISLAIGIIFGGNQVASKVALQQFPPMLCAALAFTFSSIFLGFYAWFKNRDGRVSDCIIWRLHVISATLFVCFNAIALIGLNFTLASRGSIFIAMHPFFVVVFNYFTPSRERLGWQKWLGLALALVGVLIVFGDRLTLPSGASWIGDSLILLSAAFLGLIILHIRTVTYYVSPLQATLWQMSLSVPIFWLAALTFESPLSFPQFSHSWGGIIYMGLMVNALAFVIRAELFRRYSASTISAFLFISPLAGLGSSYWFLGEPLNWLLGLGGGMIALGIFLVYRFS